MRRAIVIWQMLELFRFLLLKRSSLVKATHYIFYLYLFIKMTQYFISQGVSGSTIPLAPLTGGQNQIIQIWHFCRTLAKRDR